MWGNVRRHAYRNACRSIEQEIRQARRQDYRLFQRAIEIFYKIHRIFVDIGEHLLRQLCQACFSVAHGCRSIPVHRAKVPLSINQGIAHGEILRHTRHGVIHRGIAMWVIFTQHFADDARRFAVGGIRTNAHIMHGIEDAPMYGL